MMAVSMAASAAGAISSAQGAQAAGQGQAQAAYAKAQSNRYNAQILDTRALEAERNRGIAYDKAASEVSDTRVKNRAVQGQIRAAYGANGLSAEGSVLDVLQATAVEQEMDVAKILYRGDLEGVSQTDQAASFRQQAALARMGADYSMLEAQNAKTAADYGSATALLSGLSSVMKSGASMMSMGMGGGGGGAA